MGTERSAKAMFYASVATLLLLAGFAYGILVGVYKWWPRDELIVIKDGVQSLMQTGEWSPKGRIMEPAAGAPRERFVVYQPDRLLPGLYLFMGWDGSVDRYAVWLHGADGRLLHRWVLRYEVYDPDGPSNLSDAPHGMHVQPDGSLLVTFDKGDVLPRLDACGDPIWLKEGVFHHSLEPDADGLLWTWRSDYTSYGNYQYITQLDPGTGETVTEIDFLNEVVKAQPDSTIFSVRADHPFPLYERDPLPEDDLFHPNDVEVLTETLASQFPMFNAGDLLISLRNLHLVAVLDREALEIKWWNRGPWTFQHDPDFLPDGTISVFDNNTDRRRSEILKIEPASKQIVNELLEGGVHFYTYAMGKHMYLPNGNVLITSPHEGRAIEVTSTGEPVMEFNNVMNEQNNYHVENAKWLPENYFLEMPNC